MKKSLLLAGLCAIALSASAQNPFAYGIKTTGVQDGVATGETVVLKYTLNAAAESGKIDIYDLGKENPIPVKTIELTAEQLTKADHEVEVAVGDLPGNTELAYTVTTTGAKITAAKEIFSDLAGGGAHQYWSPYGVACDNDPDSKHFGRVLITESQGNMGAAYFTKASGVGPGLYEYDPQGNPVQNASVAAAQYGYNPFQWVGDKYTSTSSAQTTRFNAKKVRIAKDGRIFLGVLNCINNPIYTVNPDNLGEWTPLFKGTIDANESGYVNDGDGNMVAAPSAAFDIIGEGSDLKLVNLGSKFGQSYSYGNYTCYEYPIGEATEWATKPGDLDEVFPFSMQYTISAQSVSLAYDKDGGIWYAQYRGAPTEAQPAIKHATFNAEDGEWVEDYSNITTVVRGGGIAFNKDYTLLAIPKANNTLGVYTVENTANGPVLTEKYSVTTTTIRGFNDICFDYADNIYSCDNGKEVMQQIQLPVEDPTTLVPCPTSEIFKTGTVTAVKDLNVTKVEARKYMQNGQLVIEKDGVKYNAAGQVIK